MSGLPCSSRAAPRRHDEATAENSARRWNSDRIRSCSCNAVAHALPCVLNKPMLRSVPILLLGLALLNSCARVTLHHFVIPAGYTGLVAVVSDPRFHGIGSYWEGERVVHIVPPTGVVCVSPETGIKAHLLSAEYTDGAKIYSYGEGRAHPPDKRSIRIQGFRTWHGPTDDIYLTWLALGDEATVEALMRAVRMDEVAPRMLGNGLVDLTGVRVRSDFRSIRRYCTLARVG